MGSVTWPYLEAHKAELALLQTDDERKLEEAPSLLAHELNPSQPWPQLGKTSLLDWGTQVSMEYRVTNCLRGECHEWAKESRLFRISADIRLLCFLSGWPIFPLLPVNVANETYPAE